MKSIGLYIHYPYCLSKCPYCDFNSHVASAIPYQDLLKAYIKELEYYRNFIEDDFTTATIFFGGGTPSLMDNNLLAELLGYINKEFKLTPDIEITLEANPSTVENKKIKFFSESGINRISLGVQSFDDDILKFLGRKHDANTAISALESIKQYFDNFSLDLIYGIHNQNIRSWEKNLNRALEFNSNHISLYQLTIEKGTEFYRKLKNKQLPLMDDDTQADLYDFTYNKMLKKGYHRYEVSNFAKPGFESKHNLGYWHYLDYIGIGAGAHSRLTKGNDKYAFVNHHKPEKWLSENLSNGNAVQSRETLELDQRIEEFIMMGLRLKEGINLQSFQETFKQDFFTIFNSAKLDNLINNKLLQINNHHLIIPANKTGITNYIIREILT